MTSINSQNPHIVFTIESDGSLSSEAHNYPNTKQGCQGEAATKPFEEELAAEGLIPPSKDIQRRYKTPDVTSRIRNNQQIQQ